MIYKTQKKTICAILLLFVLFTFFPSNVDANAAITYNFYNDRGQNLDNVDSLVYDCLDRNCANVKIPNFVNGNNHGNSNDNSPNTDLTITFPSRLETYYGYAIYYFKDGYLPVASFANWAGTGSTTHNIVFSKKSGCSSHIENFRIINAENPNLPVQIFVKAKMDASTYSAFRFNTGSPQYIPMDYKDFYSAETSVILRIYDAQNDVIFSDAKFLNLFVDSSDEIKFEWTPRKSGLYKAIVTTEITDNQCSSQIPQSASSEFSVVRTSLDKCYTILNNLRTSVVQPYVDEDVKVTANKISNYRYTNGDLEALPTDVDLKIYDENGNLESSQKSTISKNLDTINPVEFSFDWKPSKNGMYKIIVNGLANDQICEGKENIDETETLNVLVNDQGRRDLNLNTIGNKEIYENNELRFTVSADYNGYKRLTFKAENLPDGASFNPTTRVFSYTPSYDTVSHNVMNDIINILGFDLEKEFFVTFKVTDGVLNDQKIVRIKVSDLNRNPGLDYIEDINVNEGDLVKITPRASDADNDQLLFTFTSPLNRRGEWQTKAGDKGVYFVKVSVRDNFFGEDSQIVKITVNSNGIPPHEKKRIKNHDLKTTSLHFEKDEVIAGGNLIVYTKIKNDGNVNEDNIKIRLTIPELGIIEQHTINHVEMFDQKSRMFIIKIPEKTKLGYYVLKSQVFNGNSEETEAIEFKLV